jgi:hypothetical protein
MTIVRFISHFALRVSGSACLVLSGVALRDGSMLGLIGMTALAGVLGGVAEWLRPLP